MNDGDNDLDVSVIMPAWKAAGFIEHAIRSALASEGVSVEVVAVDDASPDATFETLKRLATDEPRLRVDRLETNGGPSAARNRAIDLARGRFIAVLDADDAMKPDRLARLVAHATTTGADIVVDDMLETRDTQSGGLPDDRPFLGKAPFDRERTITLADYVAWNMPFSGEACLGYLKPLFRASALKRTGLRYDPALRNSEDYYLVAHLLADGAAMRYLPQPGYVYQRAEGSTSHRMTAEHSAAWLAAEAKFRTAHETDLSADTLQILEVRGKRLRAVHQFMQSLDMLKARRIGGFVQLLTSDPGSAPFTFRHLARSVGERVQRKLKSA
ncbi:MAG: glycosyltransferase family 2 protein [Hyphomonadaceae bacterium]